MWLHCMIYKEFINVSLYVEKELHRMVSYGRKYITINAATSLDGYVHPEGLTIIALTITLSD